MTSERNIVKRSADYLKNVATKNRFSPETDVAKIINERFDIENNQGNHLSPLSLPGAAVESQTNERSDIENNQVKQKCNYCNFKKKCYLFPFRCTANDRTCHYCHKSRHFPNSKKCFKMRRDKFKMKLMQNKPIEGCQSLRDFLKCKHYRLTSKKIPYDLLQKPSNSSIAKGNRKEDPSLPRMSFTNEETMKSLMSRIQYLERKDEVEIKIFGLPCIEKSFLQFYLLINMDLFYVSKYMSSAKVTEGDFD